MDGLLNKRGGPLGHRWAAVSILRSGRLPGFWWATFMLIPSAGGCGGGRESLALESEGLIAITSACIIN